MQSLSGKVAIVTGGSRGIGLAIARALVADGVHVAITGRSAAHLSAARPKIESAGPRSLGTLQTDLRLVNEAEGGITTAGAPVGRIGVLVYKSRGGTFCRKVA